MNYFLKRLLLDLNFNESQGYRNLHKFNTNLNALS
jgi:hypothetical protein